MCQGPKIDVLLETGVETNHESHNSDVSSITLKQKFVDLIKNSINCIINGDRIASVVSRGKTRKHLKIEFVTKEAKIDLLNTMRTVKPTGLFASDYLTKIRSNLFFKVRQLKKNNRLIKNVHLRNGIINCELMNNNRLTVCTENDLIKLTSKLEAIQNSAEISSINNENAL